MRILLINPFWSYTRTPLATNLAELAAYIWENGHPDVHILDLNYETFRTIDPDQKYQHSLQMVEKIQPDIIGITCNTVEVPFCVRFTRLLKQHFKTPIVLGGIHPTFRAEQMFNLCPIDFIIRGEGEVTFLELLNYLSAGPSSSDGLSRIDGLSYKQAGIIKHNPDRPLLKDLSILPFPAFDLLKFKTPTLRPVQYHFGRRPQARIEATLTASRGCPFKCVFCSANCLWKYQRRKPIYRVLKEVDHLIDRLKTDYIRFDDDCFTLNQAWSLGIMRGLKKRQLSWGCLTRIDQIDPALLKIMGRSGCLKIYHGIESGSPKMRNVLGKKYAPRITNDYIQDIIKKEKELGLEPVCSFMVGIPGETSRDFWDTINLALSLKDLGAKVQLWIMTPYPDTPAVKLFKKYLKRLNRWDLLKQGDVFLDEQLILYGDTLDIISQENPDNFFFQPKVCISKFVANYNKAEGELGIDTFHKKGAFLYNYFSREEDRDSFITFTERRPIKEISNARPGDRYLRINCSGSPGQFRSLKILVQHIKPRGCYISIDCQSRSHTVKFCRELLSLLKFLNIRHIESCLTRPLRGVVPDNWLKRLLKHVDYFPQDCRDCLEMFHARQGKIYLCWGKLLGSIKAFNGRQQVHAFFMEYLRSTRIKPGRKALPLSQRSRYPLYKLSPHIYIAEIDLPKNTSRNIDQLYNCPDATSRFKSARFIDIFNYSPPRTSTARNYIIFNAINEEYYWANCSTLDFLKLYNGRNSAKYISNTFPKKQKRIFRSVQDQFINSGVLIPT
jgi:anaerobic magnesium-protoporphyrin IX monomethyl ester cyclase